ncbi:MAG: metal-dependent hydrolase [Candidatus Helarchaeota archaeon]
MDTFSHIVIAFLIYAKIDLRLAFIAGFMGMFVDLDVLLYPLSKKYPIFDHRGIGHSFLVVIAYTSVIALIFTTITGMNFIVILLTGLSGSLLHITCDSMTNYGIYSLYPIIKKHIKLEIFFGVDPLAVIFGLGSFSLFFYYYFISNFSMFWILCNIMTIIYILYFLVHCILKIIVYLKFRTRSLPTFSRIVFKIIENRDLNIKSNNYKLLKWKSYNLITKKLSIERTFKLPLYEPKLPLSTEEDMIAYSYNLKEIQRIFNRVDFLICEIVNNVKHEFSKLFWYSLELNGGKFGMGAYVLLKKDGSYKIKRNYPFINSD